MRTKVLLTLLAAAALALPAGALADKGGHGGGGPKQATYEFHGTLSGYLAAVGAAPGSITILISKANRAGRPFVGQTLTFPVSSLTKVEPTGGVIVNGDQGSLQLRGAAALGALGLQALTPRKIQDETLGGGA